MTVIEKVETNDVGMFKWCIQDENNYYVHEDSIKKCGNDFFYIPTKTPERWYTTQERTQKALNCLMLHNSLGKLKHSFHIIIK